MKSIKIHQGFHFLRNSANQQILRIAVSAKFHKPQKITTVRELDFYHNAKCFLYTKTLFSVIFVKIVSSVENIIEKSTKF
jgi:hypothetical protein